MTSIRRVITGIALAAAMMTLSSCGGGGGGGDTADTGAGSEGGTVSFSGRIQPIFNNNCALSGCHDAAGTASGMSLVAGSSYDNLVNRIATSSGGTRVVPGDSGNSVLWLRVSGTSLGNRMPKNASPLSASDQQSIKDWIDQGALNN